MRNLTSNSASTISRVGGTVPPSDEVIAAVLAGGDAQRVAVPQGARYVVFGSNADFFAAFGGSTVAAEVPDATGPVDCEINPAAREIPGDATHISVASADPAIVTLSFYGA